MELQLELVSLSDARINGLKHYFTGKPCKKNHISLRQTSDRACIECKKEKFKKIRHTENYKNWLKNYKQTKTYKIQKRKDDKKYNKKNKELINSYKQKYKKSEKGIKSNKSYLSGATYNSESSKIKRLASKRASEAKRKVCMSSEISNFYQKEISDIYLNAQKLGNNYHVDHIVPINHKKICGLHVPWNLQILHKNENMRKSNKIVLQKMEL